MATYSSAPQNEIVTFTKSKTNPGSGNQPFNFDLVTVQDNEIYQPLFFYFSGDSGGVSIEIQGTLISNFISGVSELDNTGSEVMGIIKLVNNKIGLNDSTYINTVDVSGPNATTVTTEYGQITDHATYGHIRYYPGTIIQTTGFIHDYNNSNEVAALKVGFLKTTFP